MLSGVEPPNVGIVIQARMGSSRLPGKVLEFIGPYRMIELLVARMRLCREAGRIIIATSDGPGDDPIAQWCADASVDCFRGSEEDVLGRYLACAQAFGLDIIVRVTADNPLTDPEGVDLLVRHLLKGRLPYAHNKHRRGYPFGTGAECLTASALAEADRCTASPSDREHVTTYWTRRTEASGPHALIAPGALQRAQARFTVDYLEDVEFLRALDTRCALAPERPILGYLECLAANPDLMAINAARVETFAY